MTQSWDVDWRAIHIQDWYFALIKVAGNAFRATFELCGILMETSN